MNFLIGCALWGYKGWVGELFPAASRSTDFLRLYSQRFTAVEGNTTFYSVPDAKTVARWANETPAGFQFCPKLPKQFTHTGVLQTNLTGTLQFLERMQGLGDRLGPILIQLPPSYSPTSLKDLEALLTALPQEVEFAVEVRHPNWFKPLYANQLNELLAGRRIGRVLLDTRPIYEVPDDPQLHSERKKPKLPVEFSVTAPFSVIRYISHPDQATNHRFLQDWLTRIDQWLRQGTYVYFFVHCPLEERSPANARYIQQLLEQQSVPIPPLPWNLIEQPPTQLTLL